MRPGRTLLIGLMMLGACGTDSGDDLATDDSVPTASPTCDETARKVDEFNILDPAEGGRRRYLVLLHTLQRDCPVEAQDLGLWADYLPPCERLDQEDCFAG